MSASNRIYSIPEGFLWDHAKNTYVNNVGFTFNSETGETLSDNGLVMSGAPSAIPTSTQPINSAAVDTVASRASDFIAFIDSLGTSRDLACAKTKIDEAVMWVERHLKTASKS